MTYDKKDPLTKAIENNPCGICRAKRLPRCMCKGGGGGGSSDAEDETYEPNDSSKATTDAQTLQGLNDIFSENPFWEPVYNADDCYIYNDPLALFSITLDLSAGSLVFTKRDGLSKEELEQLEKFLDVVESELNSFKAELNANGIDTQAFQCHRGNGNLTIKIPNPTYFDAFVQQLIDKNLLSTDSMQKKHDSNVVNSNESDEQQTQVITSTAPTPFDISKGPKFED